MENLVNNTRAQRVMNAVAAGTSNQNSDPVDMQNYEGVLFVAQFGTLTATQVTSLKAQQSAASGANYADLDGAAVGPLADDDDNKVVLLDVKNPATRYVRCVIGRGTANAAINGVVAIQYGPRKKPVTQHDTVAASKAVSF